MARFGVPERRTGDATRSNRRLYPARPVDRDAGGGAPDHRAARDVLGPRPAERFRSEAVAAADQIERIAQVSYEAGERGILELLDAYRIGSTARGLAMDSCARPVSVNVPASASKARSRARGRVNGKRVLKDSVSCISRAAQDVINLSSG